MSHDRADYEQAHELLPFLDRFLAERSRFDAAHVALRPDGALSVRLEGAGEPPVELRWVEKASGAVVVPTAEGVVEGPPDAVNEARHLASRLRRLLRGRVPGLLAWRNRNPLELFWGARLFERLRPGLFAVGRTRWFAYSLARVDEYEGLIGLDFESRSARVQLRLTLTELLAGRTPVHVWGPIALEIAEDERSEAERALREHRVEDFVAYLLSRNLPPMFTLAFERNDPPEGYRPADWNIDLLEEEPPDDTSWFQMLQASPDEGVTTVYSCDLECFNLFSYVSAPGESSRVAAPWTAVPDPGHLGRVRRVHMDEYTTIMGDDGPDRCLEQLAAAVEPPELILYVDSCLSRLLGEDVDGAVRRFREQHSVPVVRYDIDLRQEPYLAQVRTFWERLLDAIPPDTAPLGGGEARSASVAFVGFGEEHLRELLPVLARRGVSHAGTVFPRLDLPVLRALGRAGLLVLNAWDYVQTVFGGALERVEVPRLSAPLPFGFRASAALVDEVAGRLGLPRDLAGQDEELAALRERFDRVRARLRGRAVTLVARAAQVGDCFSPARRFGIALVDVLRELGLALDVLLFHDAARPADEAAVREALGLAEHPEDRVVYFHHWSELRDALGDSRGDVVYTETYRDRRVTHAGRPPLTLRAFAPGFRGAIRTAENVLDLVENPFFRRFQAHLPDPWRPAEGGPA